MGDDTAKPRLLGSGQAGNPSKVDPAWDPGLLEGWTWEQPETGTKDPDVDEERGAE
jgi:hypothetical protein